MDNTSLLSEIRKIKPKHLREKEKVHQLKFGERRKIAIFFLDLHGFTTLSEYLDPEEIKGVIDEIFTIFSDLIEKYHGYIDKYEGDLIMALFGAKKSTESNVERALRASLEILSYLKKINEAIKGSKHQIGLRIGIHYGLVVTGKVAKGRDKDYTVMGDAVNVAERLQSNAPLNTILVSEEAIKMISNQFRYTYFKELKLKGREKAIKSYIVEGIKERFVERWEKKSSKTERYIGREEEIRKIEKYYKENRRGMVIIAGEGGIGKSRLANEIYSRAHDKFSLLKGHTISYVISPFYPIIDILDQIFSDKGLIKEIKKIAKKDGVDFEKDIKTVIDDVLLYKSNISEDVSANFIRIAKSAFLKLMMFYIKAQKGRRLIFQIEDFHWIDESSLMVFKYLVEQLPDEYDVLFVITTREDANLMDWLIEGSLMIKLDALDINSRKKLFKEALKGSKISETYINKIVTMSGGNPLYLEEIARIVLSKNIRAKDLGKIILPDTVEGIILARFDNLLERDKLILQIASCFGIKFKFGALSNVMENLNEDTENLDKVLNYLTNVNFLKKKDRDTYTFIHYMEKEAIYNTILNYNKKLIHNTIGLYYESGNDYEQHITEIIYHFISADNKEKIIEHFNMAANYYYNRMEMKELKNLIDVEEKILKGIDNKDYRFDLLDKKILYYYRNAQYSKILDIVDNNLNNYKSDKKRYNILLHRKSVVLERIGKIDESIEILRELIRKKQKNISKFKLYSDLSKCYFHKDMMDDALKYLKIAKKYIRSNYDRLIYYDSLSMLYYSQGELDKSVYYLNKEKELKNQYNDKYALIVLQSRMALITLESGKYSLALKYARNVSDLIKKYFNKIDKCLNLNTVGIIYSMVNMCNDAIKSFEKGIEIAQKIGYLRGETIMNGNMGNCLMWQENWKEAKLYLTKAIGLSKKMKWTAFENDLLSDLFFCNIMLANKEESKSMVSRVGNDIKGKAFKLIYKKKILNEDVTIELEKFIDEIKNENWLLSNNEIILSLFHYLLDNEVKNNRIIKTFLLNESLNLLRDRKGEMAVFPTYDESFSMKRIKKMIDILKEE
ncbi:AAA family ATPase [candidate division WOR-3 bacterium]|nr:AAA family ATPase [candidate division WOR-3 bacterium]